MADTYLAANYKDREQVKSLGARWDPEQRKWFVPGGRDLAPFAPWLPSPAGPEHSIIGSGASLAGSQLKGGLAVAGKGIALSQLLAGVAQAVAQAYRAGVWTKAEVLKVDARRGHVYLELAERDGRGESVAQARAVIWADTANRIVPDFQLATGVVLGGGIKLLVRAKPAMHALYGMSLVIDAIDPEYTLGDLEAKKREIRTRLQREGLFDANRKLPAPWDFNAVLVVAPQGAAGLGDFRAEAERLERFGICNFVYVHSRFQGEGAAAEVLAALSAAMEGWRMSSRSLPDAVVIIRGGGAVNDLAWLNDYDLVRVVCELEVPVFTGIGHERDNTMLDEVAHTRFDTPSKVIAGIEQVIRGRTAEARENFQAIIRFTSQKVQAQRRAAEQADQSVGSHARRHLANASERTTAMMSTIRVGALQSLRDGSELANERFLEVRHQAVAQVGAARQAVPALLAEIRSEARQSVRAARSDSSNHLRGVFERVSLDARSSGKAAAQALGDVAMNARRVVVEAGNRSEALMREIAGQGPEKSLGRGFAIVRAGGAPVTSAKAVVSGASIEIQFRDGKLAARAEDNKGSEST